MKTKTSTILSLALVSLLVASLTMLLVGCGTNSSSSDGSAASASAADGGAVATPTVIKVGATPAPHAEILAYAAAVLQDEGITLEVVEYTDYVKPNLDTDAGDIVANYFQHLPYLEEFNAENNTDLVSVSAIHFEPLGIYPGNSNSLASLPDGARVAVPNDTTNEARALQLLAAQGLITLPANADLTITPKDITNNPKNLQFVEVEAAQLPLQLAEVDIAVINGNYALGAKLDPQSVLAAEDVNSQAAQTYANILVVKKGDEKLSAVEALIKALTSAEMRAFINSTYDGVVVPVF